MLDSHMQNYITLQQGKIWPHHAAVIKIKYNNPDSLITNLKILDTDQGADLE